jgi:hypothetical protein
VAAAGVREQSARGGVLKLTVDVVGGDSDVTGRVPEGAADATGRVAGVVASLA